MEQRLFRESRILCVILRERNPHRPSHQQVRVQRLGPHQIDRKCMRLDGTQHVESHRTSTPLTRQQPCSGRAGDRRENRNGTRSSNTPHDMSPEGSDQGDVVPWVIVSKTSHLTPCFGGCYGHHITPRARLLKPTIRFQPSTQDGRSCFSGFPRPSHEEGAARGRVREVVERRLWTGVAQEGDSTMRGGALARRAKPLREGRRRRELSDGLSLSASRSREIASLGELPNECGQSVLVGPSLWIPWLVNLCGLHQIECRVNIAKFW